MGFFEDDIGEGLDLRATDFEDDDDDEYVGCPECGVDIDDCGCYDNIDDDEAYDYYLDDTYDYYREDDEEDDDESN